MVCPLTCVAVCHGGLYLFMIIEVCVFDCYVCLCVGSASCMVMYLCVVIIVTLMCDMGVFHVYARYIYNYECY